MGSNEPGNAMRDSARTGGTDNRWALIGYVHIPSRYRLHLVMPVQTSGPPAGQRLSRVTHWVAHSLPVH